MKKVILLCTACALLTTACTTPGKRTAWGAAGGAAVGGIAGAVIANNTGHKSEHGAIAGALVGLAAGGVLGGPLGVEGVSACRGGLSLLTHAWTRSRRCRRPSMPAAFWAATMWWITA